MKKYLHEQTYNDGDLFWSIPRIMKIAEDLEPFALDLKALNVYGLHPKIESFTDYITHLKLVSDADLSYPIILNKEGEVIDGRHRIAKATIEGKKHILAVRFVHDPQPDYEQES